VRRRPARAAQNVVVVNGTPETFDLLEPVLDAGHYDMVFVADVDHAYSQVKQNRPDLVVVCLGFDDPAGFQVLSMLRLDPETSRIPVVTCANPIASDERAGEETGEDDFMEQALPQPSRLPMN
jgi:DNA-binding response OmpR family regulator